MFSTRSYSKGNYYYEDNKRCISRLSSEAIAALVLVLLRARSISSILGFYSPRSEHYSPLWNVKNVLRYVN